MIKLEFQIDIAKINRELNKLPVLVQRAALESGVKPAAQICRKRVMELVPQSAKTGTANKQSQKTKSARKNIRPMRELVAVKVLKPVGTIAMALFLSPRKIAACSYPKYCTAFWKIFRPSPTSPASPRVQRGWCVGSR